MVDTLRVWVRIGATVAALVLFAACASAQGTGSAAPAPAAAAATPGQPVPASADSAHPAWLVSDDAARTITIALVVTRGPEGALINGNRAGKLQITVPVGWTVQWDWRSADSSTTHSLVLMEEREKLPTEGGRAVFTNAMTKSVTAGLPVGQVDRTTFSAEQAGWYWLLCGVPGHAIAGEFISLRVDPEAKTAGVKVK
jgi:hypothetical protein